MKPTISKSKNEAPNRYYRFAGHDIQILGTPEEPLFVAKDVCDALGLNNTAEALSTLESEDKLTSLIVRSGQRRRVKVINEPGLYALITKSIKPEAKKFKNWVFKTVLPSIRKEGYYANPGVMEEMKQKFQMEQANERLLALIHNPQSKWSADLFSRFSAVCQNRTTPQLCRMFGMGESSIRKARKLLRHSQGDFVDRTPKSLQSNLPKPEGLYIDYLMQLDVTPPDLVPACLRELFGEAIHIDRRDRTWVTAQGLGKALGYANPKDAMKRVYKRHKAELGRKHTRLMKVTGTQNQRHYDLYAVIIIATESQAPNARAVINAIEQSFKEAA